MYDRINNFPWFDAVMYMCSLKWWWLLKMLYTPNCVSFFYNGKSSYYLVVYSSWVLFKLFSDLMVFLCAHLLVDWFLCFPFLMEFQAVNVQQSSSDWQEHTASDGRRFAFCVAVLFYYCCCCFVLVMLFKMFSADITLLRSHILLL